MFRFVGHGINDPYFVTIKALNYKNFKRTLITTGYILTYFRLKFMNPVNQTAILTPWNTSHQRKSGIEVQYTTGFPKKLPSNTKFYQIATTHAEVILLD